MEKENGYPCGRGRKNSRFPDEALIDSLRKTATVIGGDSYILAISAYDAKRGFLDPSSATIRKRFKTWRNAAKVAGLKFHNEVSKEKIADTVQKIYAKKGFPPCAREVGESLGVTESYVRMVCGGAYKEFIRGLNLSTSNEDGIKLLYGLYCRLGYFPSVCEFGKANGTRSYRWYFDHFGSNRNIRKALEDYMNSLLQM